MTRRIRAALLAVLTALALSGPPVGTQVPVVPVPPLGISNSVDLDVLRETLVSTQPAWAVHFAQGGVLENLSMRCLFSDPTTRVYWGGLHSPGASASILSNSQSLTGQVHSFAYVHVVGQPPSVPPDQLHLGSYSRHGVTRVLNRLSTEGELAFLIFVLREMAQDVSASQIPALATWFQLNSPLTIENFSSCRLGDVIRLDFRYRQQGTPTSPPQSIRVSATPTGNGFDQVVVQ